MIMAGLLTFSFSGCLPILLMPCT